MRFIKKLLVGATAFGVGYYFLFVRSGFSSYICIIGEGNLVTGTDRCVGLLAPFSDTARLVALGMLLSYSVYIALAFDS